MRRTLTILAVLAALALAPASAVQPGPIAAAQQAEAQTAPQVAPAATTQAAPSPQQGTAPVQAAKRSMELADILAWKNIGAVTISNDGRWLAYRLSPIEGDSEVVVRAVEGEKTYRFPVGEAPAAGAGRAGGPGEAGQQTATLRISEDSTWVAFMVYPTREESARLRRQRRPIQAKVQALDLAAGKDVTFENVRRFAFLRASAAAGWRCRKRRRRLEEPRLARRRRLPRQAGARQAAARPRIGRGGRTSSCATSRPAAT